ncbi:MAG: sugar transferase, partial [Acidobacteriota bacterium]
VLNVVLGVVSGMAVVLALSFFYRGFSYSRLTALYFVILAPVLALHGRYLYRTVLDLMFGHSQWLKRVIVVGDTQPSRQILDELIHHKSDYLPLGIVSRDPTENGVRVGQDKVRILGTVSDCDAIIETQQPDLVILADADLSQEEQLRILEVCFERNIHWKIVPKVVTPPDQDIGLSVVAGLPLLGSKGNNITGFNYVLKRVVDVVAASLLMLLLSPLMLVVAALIRFLSPGPVLFSQVRVGYRGRPFEFYKFRSMHLSNDDSVHRDYVQKWINGGSDAELQDGKSVVHKLTDDPRIIPYVGAFIRKFSIDELPQLLNVLKGDMSLVGPRPCLPYEVEMYRRWHKMRFDALPGITGLWQVSGRNRLSFDQMVALDIRYLQNWSLGLDLSIMAKTPYVILFDKAY